MESVFSHLVCFIVFISIMCMVVNVILEFMPFFLMGVIILMPFYGLIKIKILKFGIIKKILSEVLFFIGRIHFLNKNKILYWVGLSLLFLKNWYYIILSIFQGITYSIVCFVVINLFWNIVRWAILTYLKIEIPTCIFCMKTALRKK